MSPPIPVVYAGIQYTGEDKPLKIFGYSVQGDSGRIIWNNLEGLAGGLLSKKYTSFVNQTETRTDVFPEPNLKRTFVVETRGLSQKEFTVLTRLFVKDGFEYGII